MPEITLAHAWVDQVRRCTDTDLPDYVRRGVLSGGLRSGELLEELLVEPEAWDTRVAEHAIVLLGQLRHEPAIPHLSDLLWDEPQYEEEVREALVRLGEPAIPALVTQLRHGRTEVLATLVALSAGKLRDDVREAFQEALVERPDAIVPALAALADPGLLPAMQDTLERLDEHDPQIRHTIVSLVEAIETLGGDPGEMGARKVSSVRAARARWLALQAAGQGRPRNKKGKR